MTRTGPLLLLLAAACGGTASSSGAPDGGTPDGGAACSPGADPCAFLAAHDAARASATPAPSPPLPAMTWSDAAAAAASAWAQQCTWSHDPALQTEALGQNLYASTSQPNPAAVVASWTAEAASYDHASNQCAAGQVCGHYTQVVWRGSTGVGCASQRCTTGSPFGGSFGPVWWIVACDYAPPGNIVGQRPY